MEGVEPDPAHLHLNRGAKLPILGYFSCCILVENTIHSVASGEVRTSRDCFPYDELDFLERCFVEFVNSHRKNLVSPTQNTPLSNVTDEVFFCHPTLGGSDCRSGLGTKRTEIRIPYVGAGYILPQNRPGE